VIRRNPDEAGAYSNRAGAYAHQNRADLAVLDYATSIRIRPSWNDYFGRGEQYPQMQQADLAIQDMTVAVRGYADYFPSYLVLLFLNTVTYYLG
jgi:tetratricopeptide (TPR) repeat protein